MDKDINTIPPENLLKYLIGFMSDENGFSYFENGL